MTRAQKIGHWSSDAFAWSLYQEVVDHFDDFKGDVGRYLYEDDNRWWIREETLIKDIRLSINYCLEHAVDEQHWRIYRMAYRRFMGLDKKACDYPPKVPFLASQLCAFDPFSNEVLH